jgi:hypothetical protein
VCGCAQMMKVRTPKDESRTLKKPNLGPQGQQRSRYKPVRACAGMGRGDKLPDGTQKVKCVESPTGKKRFNVTIRAGGSENTTPFLPSAIRVAGVVVR